MVGGRDTGTGTGTETDTGTGTGTETDNDTGTGTETGRSGHEPEHGSGPRATRATVLAVLAAVVVLASTTAVWSGLRAGALTSGDPAGNIAFVDDAVTAEVREQVEAGVKAIFSYDYSNLARTERAAESVLVGDAVVQYEASFAEARRQAKEQKLVRTTNIRSTGVRELHPDTATLLVFVDQQTLRTGANEQTSSAAALDIRAVKSGGRWKIASLSAL